MSLRDELLNMKPAIYPLPVPELGTTLYVRMHTRHSRRLLAERIDECQAKDPEKKDRGIAEVMLAMTLCDEHGEYLFPTGDDEKIDSIIEKIETKLDDTLVKAMTADVVRICKEHEQAAANRRKKNDSTRGESSNSSSPEPLNAST